MAEESATAGTPRGEGNEGNEPRGGRAPKKISCEFCDCDLTPSGNYVGDLSAKAKKYRDANADLERVREQLQSAKERITELETQLTEARNRSTAPPTSEPSRSKGYTI